MRDLTLYPSDPDLAAYMRQVEGGFAKAETLVDKPHPSDKNRTLLNDIESMLEKYESARSKRGLEDSYDMREIGVLRDRLTEEYKLKDKDWFKELMRGKYKKEWVEEPEVGAGEETKAKFEPTYKVNRDLLYDLEDAKQHDLLDPTFLTSQCEASTELNKTETERVDKLYDAHWKKQ